MKILSICVPTYNRPADLASLIRDFLTPVLDRYGEHVEVLICDNSSPEQAAMNQSQLDPRINYEKNERNLGFGGNLLKLAGKSGGRYVWMISDNDRILMPGFDSLLTALLETGDGDIDCYMVPFIQDNIHGDVVTSNTAAMWGKDGTDTRVGELLGTARIPFVLFSSGVIRMNRSTLPQVAARFGNNDFIQIGLFLEQLKPDSRIRFLDVPAIEYFREIRGRFSVRSLDNSLGGIRQYIQERFGIPRNRVKERTEWLNWLMQHRGGICVITEADKDRWYYARTLASHLSVKNLMMTIGILLPKFLFGPIYMVYRTLKDRPQNTPYSTREFLRRLGTNIRASRALRQG